MTGTYTGITYSNLYCAICNGALHPFINEKLPEYFDRQKALEFWTMEMYCDNETIEGIEKEEIIPTPDTLQNLLEQRLEFATTCYDESLIKILI